jgi:hypothetical protein
MAKTAAEKQRDYRARQAGRLADLEAEAEGLRNALAAAEAEIGRLGQSQCRHPSGLVDGGLCRACGSEVW